MPQVRDQMVSSVVTIEPGTGVVDAAKRMIQEEKGPLPIVEGERPVAIVTDRDIIAHVVAEGRDPKSMTVATSPRATSSLSGQTRISTKRGGSWIGTSSTASWS